MYGYLRLTSHPLYKVWENMKARCYRKSHSGYPFYGGKGINVCPEWRTNSKAFIEWSLANGWVAGLQIDRIDSSKDYNPENCRWVTGEFNRKRIAGNKK